MSNHTECTELLALNAPENPSMVAIVNIPRTDLVRVVHSIGYGTQPLGGNSPIATKLLVLTGDGTALYPPQVLMLPASLGIFHSV